MQRPRPSARPRYATVRINGSPFLLASGGRVEEDLTACTAQELAPRQYQRRSLGWPYVRASLMSRRAIT